MNCPNCDTKVSDEQINIQTDIGKCQNCNHIFKVSDALETTVEKADEEDFDLDNPPKGTWFRYEMNKIVIGASTRSPAAFFLVPFMIIWSGGSLGGIYGSQIANNEFDPFLSLFGIPFLLGSIFFWGITLMAIVGKVEITAGKYDGTVFTGVGSIGLTKRFNWENISSINESQLENRKGRSVSAIALSGDQQITFGSGLKKNRRHYLYKALKSIFEKVKKGRNIY